MFELQGSQMFSMALICPQGHPCQISCLSQQVGSVNCLNAWKSTILGQNSIESCMKIISFLIEGDLFEVTCPDERGTLATTFEQSKEVQSLIEGGWIEGALFSSKFVKMIIFICFLSFWQFPFNFGTGKFQSTCASLNLENLEKWEDKF